MSSYSSPGLHSRDVNDSLEISVKPWFSHLIMSLIVDLLYTSIEKFRCDHGYKTLSTVHTEFVLNKC